MTGLNLETFLHLLRADLGAWATLALITLVLALMAWTSWGSRRALRKCLVLSVAAHVGLALYGGNVPVVLMAMRNEPNNEDTHDRIREIKVVPTALDAASRSGSSDAASQTANGLTGSGRLAAFDRTGPELSLADSKMTAPKPEPTQLLAVAPGVRPDLEAPQASPETQAPTPPPPETRPDLAAAKGPEITPGRVSPGAEDDIPAAAVLRNEPNPDRKPADRLKTARLRNEPNAAPRRGPVELGPLLEPASPALAADAAEPIASRDTPAPAQAGEPAPPTASEVSTKDVAAADVIAARPDAPRLGVGETNLRTRVRPGTGSGGLPNRSAVALALPPLDGAMPDAPRDSGPAPLADRDAPAAPAEAGPAQSSPVLTADYDTATPLAEKATVAPLPAVGTPEVDLRRRSRPDNETNSIIASAADRRPAMAAAPLALPRVVPHGVPALPEIRGAVGGRPLADVPEVYRSRLDPNRSARAFRSGASPASEQAVERALDWLARHQDTDGRWDGATAKYDDGTAVKGDDDFTVHCPPGETCFGECIYWEADTALTGLALLSYLGAGYTQSDGKYAETVGKGIDFLLSQQKPDGDLRGRSKAVGMYCHAMATIALCEAYALTGDERLRPPVERAINFLARARANDGLAWRYSPGAPVGDTSILGWVVMAFKSAREVGIALPGTLQTGTLGWLAKVSSGQSGGLARYQPWDQVTPTMTAEAWVCRQFLGVGGPGAASTEAAEYLLSHAPKGDGYNLYYWYYGTLAMYQHGGDAWYRWNSTVRDEIVRRQRPGGHPAGSWDPDDSPYGAKGGRIYCTALATLSLEVYYRYLRLYDDPSIPPALAPRRPRSSDRSPAPAVGRRETPSR